MKHDSVRADPHHPEMKHFLGGLNYRSREGQVGFLAFFLQKDKPLDSLPAQIGVLATGLVQKSKKDPEKVHILPKEGQS